MSGKRSRCSESYRGASVTGDVYSLNRPFRGLRRKGRFRRPIKGRGRRPRPAGHPAAPEWVQLRPAGPQAANPGCHPPPAPLAPRWPGLPPQMQAPRQPTAQLPGPAPPGSPQLAPEAQGQPPVFQPSALALRPWPCSLFRLGQVALHQGEIAVIELRRGHRLTGHLDHRVVTGADRH